MQTRRTQPQSVPKRHFHGDLMKSLDPQNAVVTHESGNTPDRLITACDILISAWLSGLGHVLGDLEVGSADNRFR
jgi:hypothetical protein